MIFAARFSCGDYVVAYRVGGTVEIRVYLEETAIPLYHSHYHVQVSNIDEAIEFLQRVKERIEGGRVPPNGRVPQ